MTDIPEIGHIPRNHRRGLAANSPSAANPVLTLAQLGAQAATNILADSTLTGALAFTLTSAPSSSMDGSWVIIDEGSTSAEVRQASISGSTVTVAALTNAHTAGAPIRFLETPDVRLRAFGGTDAAAFTRAIAGVPAGFALHLDPAVTHSWDASVTVNKALVFEGNGATVNLTATGRLRPGASGVRWRNTNFTESAAATFVNLFTESAYATEYSDWLFEDCVFDNISLRFTKVGRTAGDGTVQTTSTGFTGRVTLRRCEVKNYLQNYAVYFGGVDDCVVERSYVHHNGISTSEGDGIKLAEGATRIRILHNTLSDNTRDGIDIYDAPGVLVQGNLCKSNGLLGIDAKWNADENTNLPYYNIITENRCENNGSHGIQASSPRTIVSSNQCRNNTGHGITAAQQTGVDSGTPSDTAFLTIVSNQCQGNTQYGINLSGNGTQGVVYSTVASNLCIDNLIGIAVAGRYNTIQGNIAYGNTDLKGVYMTTDARENQVNGNVTDDPNGNCTQHVSALYNTENGYGYMAAGVHGTPTLALFQPGTTVRNTDDNTLWYHRGTAWQKLSQQQVSALYEFRLTGSLTASSGTARTYFADQALVAAANSDTLYAAFISPTFTPGAFSNVTHYGLRIGNVAGGATNYALYTGDGEVRLGNAGARFGVMGASPATQAAAMTTANAGTINTGDATSDTIIGNMRTRIAELEAIVERFGFAAAN